MMNKVFLFLMVAFTAVIAYASNGDEVLGVWLVQDKDAKIELYKTSNGELRGKCIWHKNPNQKDIYNKDPKKRNESVIGKDYVWGFTWDNDKTEWPNGKVYKDGKEYCGKIKMNPDGTLFLKGNICGTFLGKKNTWTRTSK
ncbi:MAG: DUF2147 domain-containing protein [Chitinophagales bacterium]|nr:DUF2147 domain-containing protein [Chitinophagales bacterium]